MLMAIRITVWPIIRIRHYWEIRKVVNVHKSAAASSHSFILIRQMAGLISQHWYRLKRESDSTKVHNADIVGTSVVHSPLVPAAL